EPNLDAVDSATAAEKRLRIRKPNKNQVAIDECYARFEDRADHEVSCPRTEFRVRTGGNWCDDVYNITDLYFELIGECGAHCNTSVGAIRCSGRCRRPGREARERPFLDIVSQLTDNHCVFRLNTAHDDSADSVSGTNHCLADNKRIGTHHVRQCIDLSL